MTPRWIEHFLKHTQLVGSMSKDPSTKVGAVIVRPNKTVAATGYNGFPRGVRDNAALYADRPTKLLRTIHAELNAILSARQDLTGCTIFVSPLHPCAHCAAAIVQVGIKHVVAVTPEVTRDEWHASFEQAGQLFTEAGVSVTAYPAIPTQL